ncbi:hypothetical protein H0H87_001175 [Tephrocybe sp. NHM501043]|nr:hypothetical protein H0H87_001175 [Tephrocybe sp. NHM501043]
MHSVRVSSSDETRPLLEEAPPSYCATNDVDDTASASVASESPVDEHAMSKFSRADTIWILAGLWSGVLLGAFDGRLADIVGRKGAMLTALTLFGSGTIFCGFASSMRALIAARAVAGMGGGGKQRGLYQGMANILYGLGAGVGGPLGGWVNDMFGW